MNIEEIIASAIKINFKSHTISHLKSQYEKKNNVNLARLSIQYDLSKQLNIINLQESNRSSQTSKGDKKESESKINIINNIREEDQSYYNFYEKEADSEDMNLEVESEKCEDMNNKLGQYKFTFNNKALEKQQSKGSKDY